MSLTQALKLVFVLFFLPNIVVGQFKCPLANSSEPVDGAYRDPNNCGIYYHCIAGTPYLQTCPPGLHFHIRTDSCKFITCVEPRFSDCRQAVNNKRTFKLPMQNKIKPRNDIDECEPNKNETVANDIDCRSYYHCVNGVAFPQRCPTGYFFSPKLDFKRCVTKFCVPWSEADCPIDGEWSTWSNWTECEGSCNGGGVRRRYRECNDPPPANNGKDCVGVAVEEELCDVGCYIVPSFMVSLQNSSYIIPGTVNWTQVDLNNENLYNPKEAKLDIQGIGMYFFALSATVSENDTIRLSFSGAGLAAGLRRDSSSISEISLHREALFQLSPIFSPSIRQSILTNLIGSYNTKETSWLGFEYETENYFFAATDTSITSTGTVNLPIMQIRGFAQNGNGFKSADPGYYYVSYGVGAPVSSSIVQVYLLGYSSNYRNIYCRNAQSVQDSWTKNYILNSNQVAPEFTMFLSSGSLFSSSELQVYMTAFKLNSSLPMLTVRSPSSISGSSFYLVRFRYTVIDNYNEWYSSYYYRIPETGIYYISMNIAICYSSTITTISLRINSIDRLKGSRYYSYSSTSSLVSKSVLLELVRGDRVEVYISGCLADDNNESVLNIFKIQ